MDQTLTTDFAGAVAQYGDTMLFIGWDFGDGKLQITVYPGYRFPADDRVHGHLGIFYAPVGTPWPDLIREIDGIEQTARRNYQRCLQLRNRYLGTSSRYSGPNDPGLEQVGEAIRESWAGFSLQLARKGELMRNGIRFQGDPSQAFLAEHQGRAYTIRVYDSGSMLILPGDRRKGVP